MKHRVYFSGKYCVYLSGNFKEAFSGKAMVCTWPSRCVKVIPKLKPSQRAGAVKPWPFSTWFLKRFRKGAHHDFSREEAYTHKARSPGLFGLFQFWTLNYFKLPPQYIYIYI